MPSAAYPGRLMNGRVLVVDDDPAVWEVVADYLRAAGLEARHAADRLSALSLAEEWAPDLVVLDLMLPGIDGLEVCRRLRQGRDGHPLPVIMLTALGEESDRVLGLETGADDYVTKPFSARELALRVQAVLRRAARPKPGRPHRRRRSVPGVSRWTWRPGGSAGTAGNWPSPCASSTCWPSSSCIRGGRHPGPNC